MISNTEIKLEFSKRVNVDDLARMLFKKLSQRKLEKLIDKLGLLHVGMEEL